MALRSANVRNKAARRVSEQQPSEERNSDQRQDGDHRELDPNPINPIGRAMEWVTKITTVGLEMMLPALGGGWLDKRLGTNYWALVGVVLGVTLGIWHLLLMTRATGAGSNRAGLNRDSRRGNEGE
jgi:hypothetical protein